MSKLAELERIVRNMDDLYREANRAKIYIVVEGPSVELLLEALAEVETMARKIAEAAHDLSCAPRVRREGGEGWCVAEERVETAVSAIGEALDEAGRSAEGGLYPQKASHREPLTIDYYRTAIARVKEKDPEAASPRLVDIRAHDFFNLEPLRAAEILNELATMDGGPAIISGLSKVLHNISNPWFRTMAAKLSEAARSLFT